MKKMEASPATETEIPVPLKRKVGRRSINIGSIIIVMAVVVLMVVLISGLLYVSLTHPPLIGVPQIITQKSSNSTAYIWMVMQGGGAGSIPKSDVYVQLRNLSGVYTIPTINLILASGTQGFNYMPASSSDYIAAGDAFCLSRDYAAGSEIFLVDSDLLDQYAVLTV